MSNEETIMIDEAANLFGQVRSIITKLKHSQVQDVEFAACNLEVDMVEIQRELRQLRKISFR